jgi:hypothetical protein
MITNRIVIFGIMTILLCTTSIFIACAPSSTPPASTSTTKPQSVSPGTSSPATPATETSGAPAAGPVPQACALLTVADVEKLTGYTGGTADSQKLGNSGVIEQVAGGDIITGQGKAKVSVLARDGIQCSCRCRRALRWCISTAARRAFQGLRHQPAMDVSGQISRLQREPTGRRERRQTLDA